MLLKELTPDIPYRNFQLVSLHGYYPWTPRPVSSIRIREGHENFLKPLIKFLVHRSKFSPFSSIWDDKSFFEKMNRLPGFKLSDFLIAFNSQDEIIGCLAPWSPRSVQDFIPLSYSLRAHRLSPIFKISMAVWSYTKIVQTISLCQSLSGTGSRN